MSQFAVTNIKDIHAFKKLKLEISKEVSLKTKQIFLENTFLDIYDSSKVKENAILLLLYAYRKLFKVEETEDKLVRPKVDTDIFPDKRAELVTSTPKQVLFLYKLLHNIIDKDLSKILLLDFATSDTYLLPVL